MDRDNLGRNRVWARAEQGQWDWAGGAKNRPQTANKMARLMGSQPVPGWTKAKERSLLQNDGILATKLSFSSCVLARHTSYGCLPKTASTST